jgi:predicted AlkP superfamily phosphohydrolase/phosphomutase
MKKTRIILLIIIAFLAIGFGASLLKKNPEKEKRLKLYWFIPDGFRAEPDLFNIYDWAEKGELPNIKKLMDRGAFGFSVPDYPSHTPVNFASLMTGAHPSVHGISDGAMHIEGYPLSISPIGGFRSNAKKVSPAWINLEESGLDVFLLSMPGSTPPELSNGKTVRGRWGGWGADFYAVNFQDEEDSLSDDFFSRSARLLFTGPKLTEVVKKEIAESYPKDIKSFSSVKVSELTAWDTVTKAFIYDSTDDGKENYDRIAFSQDGKKITADLARGDWSEWVPTVLKWRTRDDKNIDTPKKAEFENELTSLDVETQMKIKVIRLEENGIFRVRFFYNNLNQYLTMPSNVAEELTEGIGPMVDFADNFPPQLIYYPEDKQAFLEESQMSLNWHAKAVGFIKAKYNPEVVIHDIYTPNQMLTSRWWLPYLDPKSSKYNDIDENKRAELWQEVKAMYQKIDGIIGEIIKNSDENTYIMFSSDHGAAPLNKEVYMNDLLAKEGLLSIKYDEKNKIYDIDWEKTQAAFVGADNIYINPEGLGGNWKRASGEKYENLRNRVIDMLKNIRDNENKAPVAEVVKWENAKDFLDLPTDRVGDLIVANNTGYGLNEEIRKDGEVFRDSLKGGYKQGILPKEEKSVWTPFMISGPGIKKGFAINEPISHIDQLPTILKLLGIKQPKHIQGKILEELFEK